MNEPIPRNWARQHPTRNPHVQKALNKKNLTALGVEVLAELLLEISRGNATQQRRLRMELSANAGAADVARDIRKRFATLRRSTAFVSWRQQSAFARELADLVGLIQTRVAPDDPSEAFELLWAFLQLAPSIYERCDDSNGTIGGVMSDVMEVISDLAPQLATDGTTLADRVFEALQDNGYGEFDGAIPALSEAFGSDGLAHLKTLAQAAGTAPLGEADLAHYGFIGDPERQGEMARDARNRSAARILQDVADLEGDVDAYMARDLLWQEFCQNLSADSLRQHMRRLPDFEDIEAENRARTLAMAHSDMMAALAFFLEWPDLKSAASLIETRNAELNGNAYYHLTPAANALEADHPLAATLVRRAIILDSLQNSRSKRYGYAATHLAECDISDGQINDYQSHPTHSAFIEKLRKLHPRKSAFWSRVTGT